MRPLSFAAKQKKKQKQRVAARGVTGGTRDSTRCAVCQPRSSLTVLEAPLRPLQAYDELEFWVLGLGGAQAGIPDKAVGPSLTGIQRGADLRGRAEAPGLFPRPHKLSEFVKWSELRDFSIHSGPERSKQVRQRSTVVHDLSAASGSNSCLRRTQTRHSAPIYAH